MNKVERKLPTQNENNVTHTLAGKVHASYPGWVNVRFMDEDGNPLTIPNAVVTGMVECRTGVFRKESYKPPEMVVEKVKAKFANAPEFTPKAMSKVQLPTIAELRDIGKLPSIPEEDSLKEKARDYIDKKFDDIFDGVPSWLSNPIKWPFKRLAGFIGEVAQGFIDNRIADFRKQVDGQFKNAINSVRSHVGNSMDNMRKGVDSAMSDNVAKIRNEVQSFGDNIVSSVNQTFTDFGIDIDDKMAETLTTLNGQISDSVQRSIDVLYANIGLTGTDQRMSPAQIRNVTSSGFQFYALGEGTVLNYMAKSAFAVKFAEPPVSRQPSAADDEMGVPIFPGLPKLPPFPLIPPW